MITSDKVQHIAKLARLSLTPAEADLYAAELSQIVDYVGQLSEVETTEVEPAAQVSGLVNCLRADKPRAWDADERQAALSQAEVVENNLVKVPKII